jgi:thiol-disulfide isomerase/thioredoxin
MSRAAPLVALLLGAAACGGGDDGADQTLPDVTLPPLQGDGPPLELAGLSGPAVVNLWATWCAPCRRELPAFQDVSEQRTDVAFVGVDIGEDPAAAQAFLDDLGVTFPQYADEAAELTDALGTAALPVTLIVDDDGLVTTTHIGPLSVDELHAALEDATS